MFCEYHTHEGLKVIVLEQSGACLSTRADNSFVYALTSSSRFVVFRLLLITEFLSLKGDCTACLSLYMSKCHIVGKFMTRLRSCFYMYVFICDKFQFSS